MEERRGRYEGKKEEEEERKEEEEEDKEEKQQRQRRDREEACVCPQAALLAYHQRLRTPDKGHYS